MVKHKSIEGTAAEDSLFFQKSAFFKFYLIIFIFLVHAVNYEAYGLAETPGLAAEVLYRIQIWIIYLCGMSLPMYFFLAGYSFMLGYTPNKTLDKWKRRVYSLFIPWLLWNTIMWVFGYAVESIPQIAGHLNSGFGFELSLRSWLVDGLWKHADGPMWFIGNLIVCALAAPLFYPLIKRRYTGLISIAAYAVLLSLDNTGRYSPFMSLLFYAEGAYCAIHLHHLASRTYSQPLRLGAWLVLAAYLLFCCKDSVLNGGALHIIVYTITCVAVWVAVGDAELGPRAAKAEKYRFWIYASHYLPLECVEKLWLIAGGVSVGTAWVGIIISPVVTVALLVVCGMLVEKHCYPLWCMLTGKKPRLRKTN